MQHYTDNLNNLYGFTSIGDVSLISNIEFARYAQGSRDNCAGWRETGYTFVRKYYLIFRFASK